MIPGIAGILAGLQSSVPAFALQGALVRKNIGQTVGAGSTALSFQVDVYDTDGFHDEVTNTTRMTIGAAVGPAAVRLVSGVRHGNDSNPMFRHQKSTGGGAEANFPGMGYNRHLSTAADTTVGFQLDNICSAIVDVVDDDYLTTLFNITSGTTTPNDDGRTFFSIEVVDPDLERVLYPLSTTQALAAGVSENAVWGTEIYNQGGFSLADAGESIVIPANGRYRISANISAGTSVTGRMFVWITVNGAAPIGATSKWSETSGTDVCNIVSAPLDLVAGDEVQIVVQHTTATDIAVLDYTWASVERVPDDYVCILLGRDTGTQTITNVDTPVEWQYAEYEDDTGLWDVTAPTVVVAPFDGWYRQTFGLMGSGVANAFGAWGDLDGVVPYGSPGQTLDEGGGGVERIAAMGAWIACTAGQEIRLLARSVTSRTIGTDGGTFMAVEFRSE